MLCLVVRWQLSGVKFKSTRDCNRCEPVTGHASNARKGSLLYFDSRFPGARSTLASWPLRVSVPRLRHQSVARNPHCIADGPQLAGVTSVSSAAGKVRVFDLHRTKESACPTSTRRAAVS